jgi:hypothetical protein
MGVEDRVEDLGTEVRRADLVYVGERQHHAAVYGLGRLDHRVVLAADVARRLLHAGEESGVGMLGQRHQGPLVAAVRDGGKGRLTGG